MLKSSGTAGITSQGLIVFFLIAHMIDHVLYVSHESEFLINFEAWAILAQQWLVCAPLVIHIEPISKDSMLLVTI